MNSHFKKTKLNSQVFKFIRKKNVCYQYILFLLKENSVFTTDEIMNESKSNRVNDLYPIASIINDRIS